MSDAIIEYYKQFVDVEALRENLKLTPDERLEKLQAEARRRHEGEPPHPEPPPVEVPPELEYLYHCGPDRDFDPITEFYKHFVDREQLRENLKLTFEERLRRLEDRANRESLDGEECEN